MLNSPVKPCMPGLFSSEHLALQFLVPFCKKKRNTLKHRPADADFKSLTGWFEKFKNRHGIRNRSIQGEKLSAAEETVEPFLRKLCQVMEERGFTAEEIYNADETGLLRK